MDVATRRHVYIAVHRRERGLACRVEHLGIRDLRRGVAAAVRRAGSGERIVVTVDGRPVAQLGPLEPTDGELTFEDLAARGQVLLARRADRPDPEFSMPLWAGTRLDQLVREVRGR
jgi:antitoxin (DNA-binding transcriptional repressor) of toxin-antitoxin stability system